VGAYFYTPFKIEWVGLVVVALYAAVYAVTFTRLREIERLEVQGG
jgi:hypothetical protein